MKSLEELLSGVALSTTTHVEITTTEIVEDDSIPAHIYTDSEIVGYPDSQIQEDIYYWAMKGNLPISTDNLTVLDIGAGRGDVARYLKQWGYHPGKFKYIGYETNLLLTTVGNELLARDNHDGIIFNTDFLEVTDEVSADIVLGIGTLNLNYGRSAKDWPYAERMLKKAIEVSKEKVIFVLLHSNGGNDQYISYPIPNICELVLQFGYPFTVDYGRLEDVYTLTVDTSKRIA